MAQDETNASPADDAISALWAEIAALLFSGQTSQEGIAAGKDANSAAEMNLTQGVALTAEDMTGLLQQLFQGEPWADHLASALTRMMNAEAQGALIGQEELVGYKEDLTQLLQALHGELELISHPVGATRLIEPSLNALNARFSADEAELSASLIPRETALPAEDNPVATQRAAQEYLTDNRAHARQQGETALEGVGQAKDLTVPAEHTESAVTLANIGVASVHAGVSGQEVNLPEVNLQTVVSRSILDQVSRGLQPYLQASVPQVKELRIQLHPAELGQIFIAMKLENGQVHLRVNASEAATGSALQNNMQDLKHTLENQGIALGSMQMGMGNGYPSSYAFSDGQTEQSAAERESESRREERGVAPPVSASTGYVQGYAVGESLLDVTA
jgi:flagellar hook-length control protein FliK